MGLITSGELGNENRDISTFLATSEASRSLTPCLYSHTISFAYSNPWSHIMRIEIAGALSCGKSTLAGKLETLGHRIIREDLSTNPFLDLRVEDPETYDFPCQRQFVLDKIASIQEADRGGMPYVCDFSLAAERAYVSHYVSHRPDWIGELFSLMDESERQDGLPDLVIHLQCAPEEQIARIRKRGRDFEQGHDVAFVRNINDKVDEQVRRVAGMGVPLAEFRTDEMDWDQIIAALHSSHLPKATMDALRAA